MSVKISIPEIYNVDNKKLNNELTAKKTVFVPIVNKEFNRLHLKYSFIALSMYFCILSIISTLLDHGIFNQLIEGNSYILKAVFTVSTFFSGLSLGCGISI